MPSRTPEQVIARLGRRWFGEHAETRSAPGCRGCDRCTPSGCKASRDDFDRILNKNSWPAAALITQDCSDGACEDGLMLDGTGDCRACVQCAADRRRREEHAAAAAAQFITSTETAEAQEAQEALTTTLDGWSDAAHAEEARFQQLLMGRGGGVGAMLEHQVREHTTAWQDRHPAPETAAPPGTGRAGRRAGDDDARERRA